MLLKKDSSGSSEEEGSAAMAHSGHANTNKVEESDDDFNSNQFSPDTATLSVVSCSS